MQLASTVKLSLSHSAVFPARCVRCGGTADTTYRHTTHAIGWWSALFVRGAKSAVAPPACTACARAMRRQRFVRTAITIAAICVGVAIGYRLFGDAHGLKRLLVAAVALVAALPVFVWVTLSPPAFDMTAHTTTIDYEFARADYAEEFAELNDATVD